MRIELTVNGKLHRTDVPPMKPLLAVLREDCGLTGTKEGCGEGECGACSVIMDGRLVNACLIPAFQAAGREILTIEGLGSSDKMDALQEAFVTAGGVQCGFCTPGMILAGRALLEENPDPGEDEIKIALSGNICRCTGYEKIYDSVRLAVAAGYPETLGQRANLCGGEFTPEAGGQFFSPASLAEALDVYDKHRDATLMAGTTDIVPDLRSGKINPKSAIDLTRVPELRGIGKEGARIRIGACVTNGDILRDAIIKKYLPSLWTAAARSGAPAIQNRATIGGNLATASGAADLPGLLLALDASVVVESVNGAREMTLEKFIRAYREPDLEPNEILREILIPEPKINSCQKFYKRGSRKALTLSRISLGIYAEITDGVIEEFRAGAGSMSPVPIRLPKLEATVKGQKITAELISLAAETVRNEVNPRKSPAWRKAMAANLVSRFFDEYHELSARKCEREI